MSTFLHYRQRTVPVLRGDHVYIIAAIECKLYVFFVADDITYVYLAHLSNGIRKLVEDQ